ncbi:helix-turn-helix domain-containing protein [Actinoplanes sp. CA-030573]|uniref:helix-turn-helix domain-containing protein n=1 Tax=Actinoplanes sp. CA-030573 TaxID=3239898 RepID=UPI003D913D97
MDVFVQKPEVATVIAFRTTGEGRSDLVVVGPRTRGAYNPNKELPVCVRVRLRPGRARSVLGVPVAELADRAVSIEALWGAAGRRLTASLASARDPEDVASRLAAALAERVLPGVAERVLPGVAGLVESAARAISRPGARLSEVADRLGVSERHLRNVFAREVGLSPKHYARISRVRTVLDLAGREPWTEVASRAGFFDQAHMIGDFRSMMGVSPGAFLAGRLPAATPCGFSAVRPA